MDILLLMKTWMILAIILGLAEIFIPGGILLNLAISSLIIVLGLYFKLLDTWVITLTIWFMVASALFFVLYFFSDKYFTADKRIDNTFEELDLYEKKVLVTETIGPGTKAGRIELQGTTWSALSDGSTIPAGSQVSVVCKDNISLIVEPIS
jgi:membrane protein implicated in regulation of membrane protease activity